jgi:hypothetical protein
VVLAAGVEPESWWVDLEAAAGKRRRFDARITGERESTGEGEGAPLPLPGGRISAALR